MENYADSVKGVFPTSPFKRTEGVLYSKVSERDIDGEDEKRGMLFIASLWLVSGMAFLKNYVHASCIKLRKDPSAELPKILWEIGRSREHVSSLFFDRFSRFNHKAKYGAAGWLSLDLFYNYHDKVVPQLKNDLEGFVTRYWGGLENRQAATNRLKIATRLLIHAFGHYGHEQEVRVFSIASGSAQAVISAMKDCPHMNVRVVLLDRDDTALEEADREFTRAGLREKCEIIQGTPRRIEEICSRFKPHIIEMVGFLDYQPGEKAIGLLSRIRESMGKDGVLITCNINHNREKVFLDWTLLWPMIYRSHSEFLDLLVQAGFHHKNILLLYEPFKIHGLAVCRK